MILNSSVLITLKHGKVANLIDFRTPLRPNGITIFFIGIGLNMLDVELAPKQPDEQILVTLIFGTTPKSKKL